MSVIVLRFFILIILFYSYHGFICGAGVFPDPASFRFSKITQKEGLSHNNVECIIKDSDGFIWFGTRNGLCRFDGFEIKTYYSSEALNPRPKRGRPPKQIEKVEIEPQVSRDIYLNVPKAIRPYLYIPDISSASAVTFSAKFETEEQLLASLKGTPRIKVDEKL